MNFYILLLILPFVSMNTWTDQSQQERAAVKSQFNMTGQMHKYLARVFVIDDGLVFLGQYTDGSYKTLLYKTDWNLNTIDAVAYDYDYRDVVTDIDKVNSKLYFVATPNILFEVRENIHIKSFPSIII